jgi:phage baseplate assembly protein W
MPSFKPPETGHLLRDLAIHAVHRELRPVYRLTETTKLPKRAWDFVPRDGLENLAQAVILRLLTPRGELAALAHPEYGSRVHELIGQENNTTKRNLLKLFILEALKLEPRVEKVVELAVTPSLGTRSTVDVLLRVKPLGATTIVTIGPFAIELAV